MSGFTYLGIFKGPSGLIKKLIRVKEKDQVAQEARRVFCFGAGRVSVKLYVEEYEDYVEVDVLRELPTKGKLMFEVDQTDLR